MKPSLIILGIVAIACIAATVFFRIRPSSSPDLYNNATISVDVALALPARLSIPKINIDAAIESVGLTPQDDMGVPAGPADAAWFDLGPRPGGKGSAVIAGHEGWKDGIPAVFDNLYKLQVGDKVYVVDEKGATTTFMVVGAKVYDQSGDASNVFSSNDGKAHLNLITCEGAWNAVQKSYSGRLVVFTDLVLPV